MDPSKTRGFKTIAEYARDAGMKVGIVTTVTLNHATPAAFYARVPSRNDFYDIALQLTESRFDFFGGGTLAQRRGRNNDQRDAVEIAVEKGYKFVNSKEEFLALRPGEGKVLAINATLEASGAMPYEIDRAADDLSLADYTRKGIELLYNPNGFFFMIESGKIDWAGHANDAAAILHDTLAFDKAIRKAIAFAERYPEDTLIVIAGDHETGGMSIGWAGTQYDTHFDKLVLQTRSHIHFNSEVLEPYKARTSPENAKLEDLLPAIKEIFGIDYATLSALQQQQIRFAFERSMGNQTERPVLEDIYLLYGGYEPLTITLTQILNQTAGIGWTTYSHTGIPTPLFAKGANQELFGGYNDNTSIFRRLAQAMRLTTGE
jgi:alkaline phosphatase